MELRYGNEEEYKDALKLYDDGIPNSIKNLILRGLCQDHRHGLHHLGQEFSANNQRICPVCSRPPLPVIKYENPPVPKQYKVEIQHGIFTWTPTMTTQEMRDVGVFLIRKSNELRKEEANDNENT